MKKTLSAIVFTLLAMTSSGSATDSISGRYFIRSVDPQQCYDYGKDVGSIIREQPAQRETVSCGAWVINHFDEPGDYSDCDTLKSIYYRLWFHEETACIGNNFEIGYSDSCSHSPPFSESFFINTYEDQECHAGGFYLIQALQFPSTPHAIFDGDEIFNLSILAVGVGPWILTDWNQYSYVIFNLPPDGVLMVQDSDSDGLTDYQELFEYITDPYHSDTDRDFVSDPQELSHGSDPNDPTDAPTAKTEWTGGLRESLRLRCLPNPGIGCSTLQYRLRDSGVVSVAILDVQGREIRRFPDRIQTPGTYQLTWNGTDQQDCEAANGIYFWSVRMPTAVMTVKTLLLD
jgi:hypothetical protein